MLCSFSWPRLLVFCCLCLRLAGAEAQPLDVTRMPTGSLGLHVQVLSEDGPELSLEEARARFQQGGALPGHRPVLSFGIGARPQWVRLQLFNPGAQVRTLRLLVGTTWTDRIDAYLLVPGQPATTWHTGDERVPAPGLTPGLGFQTEMDFAPGDSEIYLRVYAVDPLLLPMELMSASQMGELERQVHYGYGLFFGFLVALMAYNAMLFLGLRRRSNLMYVLYLAALVLLNLAYTGHGAYLLWPGQVGVQRYAILVFMLMFAISGLAFADRFLALFKHSPRLHRTVVMGCAAGALIMVALVVTDYHLCAAWLAFGVALVFAPGMVLLGAASVRHGQVAGRYFLAAAVCGMAGATTTTLSVLGWIPFTTATFHGLEFGFLVDATLLALALAYQIRQQQRVSLQAIYLANHDPLTELHNRRGFLERARAAYSVAVRSDRPVAIVLLDLDHFKQINDQFGHEAGDLALSRSAKLLASAGRAGDVLARWGGEEFILFLPDTDLGQAAAFAERLRQSMADLRITHQQIELQLTASFGVAQRHSQTTLEELIKLADQALYEAKRTGRNRIVVSDPVSQTQAPLFR